MTTAREVPEPTPGALARAVIDHARALGFHRVGIVPVEPPRRYREYERWLADHHHAGMAYMAAAEHRRARADVRELLPTARSVIVVALAYDHREPSATSDSELRGFVARYARGTDYHIVVRRKLFELAERIGQLAGRPVAARPCVDSAPVLERELAERAGIGFVAKNTMLIAPGIGSYVVLGELLVDIELSPTANNPAGPRCGECTACLDACPTGAFPAAYTLDSSRCISYLTIEHRGAIPTELRSQLGAMIFGCDICQQVCPFNARAPDRTPPDPELRPPTPERAAPDLIALLRMGSSARRRFVDRTALRRVNREQLLRNVCVALGNTGDPRAVDALLQAERDRSPLVREHARWALNKLSAEQ